MSRREITLETPPVGAAAHQKSRQRLPSWCQILPFYDNCAKSATFWGVAHHLPNRTIAYKSVKRVIEKGGNLLISEPNIKRSYIPFAIGKIINFPYYIIRSFINLMRVFLLFK